MQIFFYSPMTISIMSSNKSPTKKAMIYSWSWRFYFFLWEAIWEIWIHILFLTVLTLKKNVLVIRTKIIEWYFALVSRNNKDKDFLSLMTLFSLDLLRPCCIMLQKDTAFVQQSYTFLLQCIIDTHELLAIKIWGDVANVGQQLWCSTRKKNLLKMMSFFGGSRLEYNDSNKCKKLW